MMTMLLSATVSNESLKAFHRIPFLNSNEKIRQANAQKERVSPCDVDISPSEQHRQQQHQDEDGQRDVPSIQRGACSCLCDWSTNTVGETI